MKHLRLREDLSYCSVDGYIVFLDVQNDRYFRLTRSLESSFIRFLEDRNCSNEDVRRMIGHRILEKRSAGIAAQPVLSVIEAPRRSAMETSLHRPGAGPGTLLSTFVTVFQTQFQLKIHPLKHVLDGLASYRDTRAPKDPGPRRGEAEVLDAAIAFCHARPYVPVGTRCLLDSIAMVRFLSMQGLHTHLVLGVTVNPFSAHCWVQYESTVLNDTVGHVMAHTPIRVV